MVMGVEVVVMLTMGVVMLGLDVVTLAMGVVMLAMGVVMLAVGVVMLAVVVTLICRSNCPLSHSSEVDADITKATSWQRIKRPWQKRRTHITNCNMFFHSRFSIKSKLPLMIEFENLLLI